MATKTLVDTDSIQTLTGKTINGYQIVPTTAGLDKETLKVDTAELRGVRWGAIQPGFGSIGQDSKNNAATPNSQFDLDADYVMLWNPTTYDVVMRVNPGAALTNNVLTAGSAANGRDQAGTFTSGSWVHFYWIWNGTTLATLSSAAAPPTGPTLPTGYTHWSYAGAVYYTAAPLLTKTRIKGSWAFYETAGVALAAGTATSETAVSVAALVPPNASQFSVLGYNTCSADGSGVVDKHADIRVVTGVNYATAEMIVRGVTGGAQQRHNIAQLFIPNVGQSFMYLNVTAAGVTSNVTYLLTGYQLPNGGR